MYTRDEAGRRGSGERPRPITDLDELLRRLRGGGSPGGAGAVPLGDLHDLLGCLLGGAFPPDALPTLGADLHDLMSGLRAWCKGASGEATVSAIAAILLPAPNYVHLHDVTLPAEKGTTQIDHIFVSRFGVFVVETKNMSGWIFGRPCDKQWTQTFPGGQRRMFKNPLRQNDWHLQAIADVLARHGLRVEIRSVVAFVGEAVLKTEMPDNVTAGADFASYVRRFSKVVLSEQEADRVVEAIVAEQTGRGRRR